MKSKIFNSNRIIASLVLAASIVVFGAAPVQAAARTKKQTKLNAQISLEQAKQIALSHAALSASNVYFGDTKLDYDDGRLEYEIEFYHGNVEYEYDIDALNGAILSYDIDRD